MTGSSSEGIKTVLHPVSDLAAAKAVYAALLGVPPQTDEAYYVGFEVRNDVGYDGKRWTTVGPADQPGTSISGLPVRLQARQDTPGRCDPRLQE